MAAMRRQAPLCAEAAAVFFCKHHVSFVVPERPKERIRNPETCAMAPNSGPHDARRPSWPACQDEADFVLAALLFSLS
jgi:hypothetical protein